MKVSLPSARSRRCALLLLIACSLSARVVGQTTPTPANETPATPAPAGDAADPSKKDMVVLSPFAVNASDDVGYTATNTLAGTRLNTSLRDTAASVSVLTSEFMSDLGALQLNNLVDYMVNTQPDWSEDGDQGNRLTEFHASYRVRGINASVARNYFVWVLPSDTYNIDRIDQSRGPNSILFGVGSPGGIISSSTKRALTNRTVREVGVVVGTDDLYRGTVDLNQPLANGKGAIRFNAVYGEQGSYREFAERQNDAFDLAATIQPFKSTTLRAEFEQGNITEVSARPWTLFDSISTWEAAGRPIQATQIPANAALGIGRFATNVPHVTLIGNTGQLADLRGVNTSNRPTPTPANQYVITDPSRAAYTVNAEGPGAQRDTEFDAFFAVIEQRIGERTFLELSYNRQSYEQVSYDAGQNSHILSADPNATLPGGIGTQFSGDYYLENNWTRRYRTETPETIRLSASTSFDLGKWGNYRLAALVEQEDKEFKRDQRQEMWAGLPFAPAGQTPAQYINNQWNLVWRRTYVTPGDWSTYAVTGGKGQLISNLNDPVSGRTLSSAWIQPGPSIDDDPTRVRSAMAVLEARYFDNRLIVLGGVRRDELTVWDRGAAFNPALNEFAVNYASETVTKRPFDTHTIGVVAHPLPWLSLNYNQSTNNNVPVLSHILLPNDRPPIGSIGKGKDMGFTLNLFDNKAYFKAIYYETESKGETGFGASLFTITGFANQQIINALVNSNQITADEANSKRRNANANTFDRTADGYEFEFTANPTPNWRISANYARSNAVENNVAAEAVPWVDDLVAWAEQYDTTVPTPTLPSIDDAIEDLYGLLDERAISGLAALGNRPDKASLVVRYTFPSGVLKDAYLGGNYRYQSGAVVGRSTDIVLYGNSFTATGLFLGKRWHFAGKRSLNVQLNIDNLFDDDTPQIVAMSTTGEIRRNRIVDPRSARISAQFQF
jgi:iron complex outermembrane receptor protein